LLKQFLFHASPSSLARASCCPRLIAGAVGCRARHSGAAWSLVLCLIGSGGFFAAHRTYLRCDGSGKADVTPSKAMLGAVCGGAVRLFNGPQTLAVAEGGIETALSLPSGLLRAPAAVWAALSTSGIRGLHLPDKPERLTIAADGDPAGRAATQSLATRAHGIGWQVSVLPAPDWRDWNDILTGKDAA
jgi:hypothetical protein